MENSIRNLSGYVGSKINFPTLMGSVGGWVFVVDVTRGDTNLNMSVYSLMSTTIHFSLDKCVDDIDSSTFSACVQRGASC